MTVWPSKKSLQNWAHTGQMKFNIKKCKLLRITRKTKNLINFTYSMSSLEEHQQQTPSPEILKLANESLHIKPTSLLPLELIESDKYLGVHLDSKLNFNSHINESTKKGTKLLNLCRRNLNTCSQSVKETAYKTIVRPHLEYAPSICLVPFHTKKH